MRLPMPSNRRNLFLALALFLFGAMMADQLIRSGLS